MSAAACSERGSALVIVLFLTVVVTALCTTLLLNSSAEGRIAANERDGERALLAARAGLGYGYHLLLADRIGPDTGVDTFDSGNAEVAGPLDGATFSGNVSVDDEGLYHIVSTGSYRRAQRSTELVVQLTSDVFRYGITAFDEVLLEKHATHVSAPAEVAATVFSNDRVELGPGIDFLGAIVSSGEVRLLHTTDDPTTVAGDVFAYEVYSDAPIEGDVALVTSLVPGEDTPDVTGKLGLEYDWYLGRSDPASEIGGTGTVAGDVSRTVVTDGDPLDFSVFRPDGTLEPDPRINAIRYVPPPRIDYAALKVEAERHDPTYFVSAADALAYLATRKVTESIAGQTLTTIRVGTPEEPELLYVRGDLDLTLDPDAPADELAAGVLKADGLYLEGGLYVSGDFAFTGQVFESPEQHPEGYYQLSIDALPHCYPAILAYSEPSSGSIDDWTVGDTPPIQSEGGSEIRIRSDLVSPYPQYQGRVRLHGLTFAESEAHLHHSEGTKDRITLRGALLSHRVRNCDFYELDHDPAVRCTRFLVPSRTAGEATVTAYRELR